MDQKEPSTVNHLHQQEQQLQQQNQDLLQEESNNNIIISESSENGAGMSLIASTRQYSIGMGKNLKPNSRLWIETIEDPKLVHLYCLEESTDEKDTFFCKHCKRFNIITRCEILHFDGGATELWEVTTHLPSCKRQKTDVEKFSLGRPSAHGGSNNKPSVRISQRLQKKRESFDNDADEGVEDLSDKENNEYAEPILYHITPTVNHRKAAVSNPSLSTPASNSLPSLSNGTPVKPGSSISPQQNNKLAPRTEMDKRYDEERLRNLVIENPPSRNTPHPSENSSMNENSSFDYIQSLSLPDPNKSYMSLPSNYHEVLSNNLQYGYDSCGNPNKRIIVRDDKNPDDAHEYRNDCYDTRCLGCAKNGKIAAKIMNGTLYVPPSKDHTCEPRQWAEIQRLQREYINNMGRKRGRTAKAETTVIKRAKVVEKESESNPEDYDADDSNIDSSNVVEPQIIGDMSKVNKAETLTKFLSSASSNTVSFYSPSAFFLSKCCKELNIKYSNDAYKFWSQILIEKVKDTSRPLTVHKTEEVLFHGFSCLSLFFTGTEANTAVIREMVNRYVYNNFKNLDNCMGHDFSQYNHETPIIREALWSFALTEIHLECLSRWFECRIAIFEGKKWKRYGNWDDEECDAPIFIMEVKDGKYNPILTLA